MSFSSGVFHNIVGLSTKLSHKTNCFLLMLALLSSASNPDVKCVDGNNKIKATDSRSKTKTLIVQHTFWHFLSLSLHDYGCQT